MRVNVRDGGARSSTGASACHLDAATKLLASPVDATQAASNDADGDGAAGGPARGATSLALREAGDVDEALLAGRLSGSNDIWSNAPDRLSSKELGASDDGSRETMRAVRRTWIGRDARLGMQRSVASAVDAAAAASLPVTGVRVWKKVWRER